SCSSSSSPCCFCCSFRCCCCCCCRDSERSSPSSSSSSSESRTASTAFSISSFVKRLWTASTNSSFVREPSFFSSSSFVPSLSSSSSFEISSFFSREPSSSTSSAFVDCELSSSTRSDFVSDRLPPLLPPAFGESPRRRDGGAARELGADHLSVGDRLQRQILGDRQRRVVRSEHTLDPAADEWRSANELLRRLTSVGVVARAWH